MSLAALRATLDRIGPVAVAVSGGVDSLTLARVALAADRRGAAFHAVSPAVPRAATARVRALAREHGWTLRVLDVGEFADPAYRANPADRCFFCKRNLYGRIAPLTELALVSGTNLDDLGDVRPGLRAAAERGVRHPYVEAGIDKEGVRAIARGLGFGEVAELPASPCLSSRVETGLPIEPERLADIERVEARLAGRLPGVTLRCRLVAGGYRIELDGAALEGLSDRARATLLTETRAALGEGAPLLGLVPYRRGSAFLHPTGEG